MDFVKKNWQLFACGAIAVCGLGIGAWQAMAAGDVKLKMQPAIQLGRNLDTASKGKIYNKAWIEEKKRQTADANSKFTSTLAEAEQRQRYIAFEERVGQDGQLVRVERKPLVDGVLPAAAKTQPRIEFRRRYREEFSRLFDRLKAGTPPTPAEYEEAILRHQKKADAGQIFDPWSMQTPDAAAMIESGTQDRSRLLWNDPLCRASLEKARRIAGMYVDPKSIGEHFIAQMEGTPSEEEIWQAQMSLWIQQDLVTALARVNEKAAAKLMAAGRTDDVWVAHLPIKRLKALCIAPLLGGPGGGGSNAPSPSWAYPSHLGRENDDKIFVVPLAVSLVIETDAEPQLLAELVAVSFFTPVRINYSRVPANPLQRGYVYGSAKMIEVEISLEAYYLHSVFGKWMPPVIQQQLTHPVGTDLTMLLLNPVAGPGGPGAPNAPGGPVLPGQSNPRSGRP